VVEQSCSPHDEKERKGKGEEREREYLLTHTSSKPHL
jgi:hypothetical protein